MNNFKDGTIFDKSRCIGGSVFWDIYRVFLKEDLSIDDFSFSQFIYKISKPSVFDSKKLIEDNIKAYNHIKKTNLPTLAFYFQEFYNGKEVLVGEDLNSGDLLFVSPNNARYNDDIIENKFNKHDNAEELLMDNKIRKILNFDDFINQIKVDMEKISRFNVGTCEDVFFFGTYKDEDISEIFYKIGIFDTIMISDQLTFTREIVLKNTTIMLNSLLEYVEMFVDISTKEFYKNKLYNEIENIDEELYPNRRRTGVRGSRRKQGRRL